MYDVYDQGTQLVSTPVAIGFYSPVPFNFDDEQRYENDPVSGGRQRLWLNPRDGEVARTVEVEFSFTHRQVGAEFVGYADVVISTVEKDVPVNYRVQVEILETVTGADGQPWQRLVDGRELHVVGDIVVPAADYWADKATGEDRMNAVFSRVNDRYARAATVLGRHGPVGPVELGQGRGRLLEVMGEYLQQEEPGELETMIARFASPRLG